MSVLIYLLGSRYCETDRFVEHRRGRCSAKSRRVGRWCRRSATMSITASSSATSMPARPGPPGMRIPSSTASAATSPISPFTLLPLHEHSGAVLHRLSRRYRRAADPAPMDFSAWFEVYLGGRWYTFDARHNAPRIGRILMARGRDATDVAIVTSFGPCTLAGFKVMTDEVKAAAKPHAAAEERRGARSFSRQSHPPPRRHRAPAWRSADRPRVPRSRSRRWRRNCRSDCRARGRCR